MTQNHLLLLFLIELFIFYLVVYSLIRLDKIIKCKIATIEILLVEMPETIVRLKIWLERFNKEFNKKFNSTSLSSQELGFLAGNLFSEIIKLRFTPLPQRKLLIIAGLIFKLWRLRKKIFGTLFARA